MAQQLNIDGSDDPAYRYKMPKLIGKVEGRGNGIKTVLVNANDVAQALSRPPSQLVKFFGLELGAQSRIDADDRAIVNGAFDTKDLQDIVFKYIEKFIVCGSCKNPETVNVVRGKKKQAQISLHCKACGADTEVDSMHKLATTIIKETSTGSDLGNKKKRKTKGQDGGASLEEGSVSSQEKSLKGKKSKKDKKEKKEKKEKKSKKSSKSKSGSKVDGGISIAQVAADAETPAGIGFDGEEEIVATSEAFTVDDAAAIEQNVEKLRNLISQEPALTNEDLMTKAREFLTNSGLNQTHLLPVLYFAAVAEQSPTLVPKFMDALSELTLTPRDELEALSCLEETIARAEDDSKRVVALKISPLVLKNLYDEDVVSEEIIKRWHAGTLQPRHVRRIVEESDITELKKNCEPIVQWLDTVESEASSDEEGADGEDTKAIPNGVQVANGSSEPSSQSANNNSCSDNIADQNGNINGGGDDDDDDDDDGEAFDPTSVFGNANATTQGDDTESDTDSE